MDWTPAPRRPTAIRRQQNLALLSAVVSGGVVAGGLILLLLARVNPDTAAGLRRTTADLVAPTWAVLRAPVDGLAALAEGIGDYFGAIDRARHLETELDTANARLRAARAGMEELRRLKALMRVRSPQREVVATARIAAATTGTVVRTAMLAVGTSDGVGEAMPVIGAEGLIGRTTEVGRNAARVLLITDPLSRVPVIVERTGQVGLAAGRNQPTLQLIDLSGATVPLVTGDRVVTSGDGGVYPPGVPVATVVDARAAAPVLRPAARLLGAGFVTVETAWLPVPATEPQGPVFDAPVPVEARRRGAPTPRLRDADAPPISNGTGG
ncbi:MAG: rod shape-determining protein MreC [Sandarakinorhabdus sp.]|nr:rod shape-determining protein MreC [Sandarakinorhabdus sp.]